MTRIHKIQQLLEKEPDDAFLNFGLAMEFIKEGNTESAIEAFDRVLTLDPSYSAAHYHKGNTLLGLGRLEEAKTVLEQGVAAAKAAGDSHTQGEMQELLDGISGS